MKYTRFPPCENLHGIWCRLMETQRWRKCSYNYSEQCKVVAYDIFITKFNTQAAERYWFNESPRKKKE